MLYDAHNHFQDSDLAPFRDLLDRQLSSMGLAGAVVNGTCEADWADVAALSRKFKWIKPSFGMHPWDAGNRGPAWFDALRSVLDANPGAPIGEIGLDRWILDRARPDDPRLAGLRRAPLAEQQEVFAAQLTLAVERDLPASIHCLDAHGALLEVLQALKLPPRGFLLHAYSGSAEMVPQFARLGAYFSYNTAFIHDPKKRHATAFSAVPVDRLLAETDAPAMSPPSERRASNIEQAPTLNHPGNIVVAYEELARIRNMPLEVLKTQLEKNFLKLFGPQTS